MRYWWKGQVPLEERPKVESRNPDLARPTTEGTNTNLNVKQEPQIRPRPMISRPGDMQQPILLSSDSETDQPQPAQRTAQTQTTESITKKRRNGAISSAPTIDVDTAAMQRLSMSPSSSLRLTRTHENNHAKRPKLERISENPSNNTMSGVIGAQGRGKAPKVDLTRLEQQEEDLAEELQAAKYLAEVAKRLRKTRAEIARLKESQDTNRRGRSEDEDENQNEGSTLA